MKRHIYVLVFVSSEHNARSAVIAGDASVKGMSLSKVLEQGWTPIRETPMGGNGPSFCSLVLLEREGDFAPAASAPAAAQAPAAAPKPAAAPPKPAAAPAKAPAKPAPAPVVEDVIPDEAPEPEPPKTSAPEKKKASDSDVSFDFLENLE